MLVISALLTVLSPVSVSLAGYMGSARAAPICHTLGYNLAAVYD